MKKKILKQVTKETIIKEVKSIPNVIPETIKVIEVPQGEKCPRCEAIMKQVKENEFHCDSCGKNLTKS